MNLCKVIVEDILHSDEANPNTLRYVNARDDASLVVLAKDTLGSLKERQMTLVKYLGQAEKEEIRVSEKVKKLWTEKLDATNVVLTVLEDADKGESELDEGAKAKRQAYFKTAKQTWEVNLGGTLMKLSKEMVGPYALGKYWDVDLQRHDTKEITRGPILYRGLASCVLVDKNRDTLWGKRKRGWCYGCEED